MTRMTRRIGPLVAVSAATALCLGLAMASAPPVTHATNHGDDLPPSLQGETFFAYESNVFDSTGIVDISAVCTSTAGETFTLAYEASGAAVGPYPGTFDESGTVTVTLTTLTRGIVISWDAEFEIDSPVGDVTGTKELETTLNAGCERSPIGGHAVEFAFAELRYEAVIKPATGGTFTDQGFADASVNSHRCAPCFGLPETYQDTFYERFTLSEGVLPPDTSGKATGGGQVVARNDPFESVTFGFNVRESEDSDRLHGMCTVLDHASGTHVKCLTVTDYQQFGSTATWDGRAEVNGVEEHYRMTVQDNGEPNQGLDTFSIVTETYEAAGNVQHGNVQVHEEELAL